jgi:hypothetical protein
MQAALISLNTGSRNQRLSNDELRSGWETYARKHGFNLLILPQLIDKTERGLRRSPAWQKLLLARVPELKHYRKIAWIDSDIIINPDKAPSIFDGVPPGKVGAVRAHAFFDNPLLIDSFQKICGPFRSTADYNRALYAGNGLPEPPLDYINTGVLVFSDFDLGWLENIYHAYEPQPKSFQEQVFLSYEIVRQGLWHELDPRFNVEWYPWKFSVYDFANGPLSELKRLCLRQVFAHSFFLHFNGNHEDMAFLDDRHQPNLSIGSLMRIYQQVGQEINKLAPDLPWSHAFYARRSKLLDNVFKATGGIVQAGPFEGMRIVPEASWSDGDLAAKLLGCYEEELHARLSRVIDGDYAAVVDIGCAEGYYAVGLAPRMPDSRVIAFDTSERGRRICRQNGERNGVADRIDIRGECTRSELSDILRGGGPTFLLVDCEGAEWDLLDPVAVPGLTGCDFIVECHDFLNPRITNELRRRFESTHDIVQIPEGPRNPNTIPYLQTLPSLDRWLLISENRPQTMHWLVTTVKKRNTKIRNDESTKKNPELNSSAVPRLSAQPFT